MRRFFFQRLMQLGCILGSASLAVIQAATVEIDQRDLHFFYQDKVLEANDIVRAKVGDVLVFKNSDVTTHNAYSLDARLFFDSGAQRPAEKGGRPYSVTLQNTGRFPINCLIHARMGFIVQVEP